MTAPPSTLHTELPTLLTPMHTLFQSTTTHSLQWRQTQLQTLHDLLTQNADELCHALQTDLSKSYEEAYAFECQLLLTEIEYTLQHLAEWMKPIQLASPGLLFPNFAQVRHEPRGVCLIIGSFNYPLQLALLPAVGSLAGGNPTVIKPSELCPTISNLLSKLVSKYFEPNVLQVIEGGIEETSLLLKQPWGLILFTGSERVGKIVAKAAAETLTPVVLELGGLCPLYVDRDCPDVKVVADRIVWGKLLNAGQTCVAPNYVLCRGEVLEEFCREVTEAIVRIFTSNPEKSDLPRIVSTQHAKRHLEMIQQVEQQQQETSSSQTKIVFGGSQTCNISEKYICPTVVVNPPPTCRLLMEEIFGPILPIVKVDSDQEAIDFIRSKPGTPLALYVFTTSSSTYEKFLKYCPSGGAVRNDVLIQFASPSIPVGGLGSSGYGCYHGKYSFDTFSHKRSCLYKPCHKWFEYGGIRYHPYKGIRAKLFMSLIQLPLIPVLNKKVLVTVTVLIVAITCSSSTRSIIADALHALANLLDSNSSLVHLVDGEL